MYLEVSERGTGKTRRLYEALKLHLEKTADVVVWVSPHPHLFERRFKVLPKEFQKRMVLTNSMKKHEFINFPLPIVVKYFVDDFDWISEPDLFVSPTGYYVTSLIKQHGPQSIFWQLVEANGGRYVTYVNMEFNRRKELSDFYGFSEMNRDLQLNY